MLGQAKAEAEKCRAAAGIPASKNLLHNDKAIIKAMKWGGAVLKVKTDAGRTVFWRVPHAAAVTSPRRACSVALEQGCMGSTWAHQHISML